MTPRFAPLNIVATLTLALAAISCQAPSEAAGGAAPVNPLTDPLPARFLVADQRFAVEPPPEGAHGEEASRLAIELLTRSRACLFNLTGHHAGMLQYTGRLTKDEWIPQIEKDLHQVAEFRFRLYPFSVRFDWIDGVNKGRASVFVNRKQYKGRMRVFGIPILGSISLDPNDRRVFESSRHPITSAGLHSTAMRILDRFNTMHALELWDGNAGGHRYGVTYEGVVNDPIEGRPKYKFTRIAPAPEWPLTNAVGAPLLDADGQPRTVHFYLKSLTVYIDKQWHIPTSVESIDWDGRRVELYTYTGLNWGAEFDRPDDNDFWKK